MSRRWARDDGHVRHAGSEGLDSLERVLAGVRQVEGLRERSRGVFYRSGRAFLHFHEDPAGLFADLRIGQDFERFRVTTPAEQEDLLRRVTEGLGSQEPPR